MGFAGLGTIDYKTPMVFLGAAMLCVGMGVGMTLQNFVLAVQNTVPLAAGFTAAAGTNAAARAAVAARG